MGRELFAQAIVIRPGRTLTICQAECRADSLETDRIIALMQATIMSIEEREDLSEDVEVTQYPPQDNEDQDRRETSAS